MLKSNFLWCQSVYVSCLNLSQHPAGTGVTPVTVWITSTTSHSKRQAVMQNPPGHSARNLIHLGDSWACCEFYKYVHLCQRTERVSHSLDSGELFRQRARGESVSSASAGTKLNCEGFPFTTGSRRKYAYCLQTQHTATHNTGLTGKRASAAVSRKNKVVRLG